MKVIDGLSGGIEPGSVVSVAELGLPVNGTHGLLLVFWKATCQGCRQESPAVRNLYEHFAGDGLEVVYVGAFEPRTRAGPGRRSTSSSFP